MKVLNLNEFHFVDLGQTINYEILDQGTKCNWAKVLLSLILFCRGWIKAFLAYFLYELVHVQIPPNEQSLIKESISLYQYHA